MKKNFVLASLLLGILLNGWAIAFLELPFYQTVLVLAGISILIMTAVPERFIFLYAITVALSYGVFLTIYAFANQQSAQMQLQYMYGHLLLTSFLLLYWILMNFIKKIGYENNDLKHEVRLLQKYKGVTKLLTLPEFDEQAQWLLKSKERNKEEAWFVKISITSPNKRVKVNLQEELERLALQSIRQKFDLATGDMGAIYLLLKNTHSEGVQIVLDRFREKVQAEINLSDSPYATAIEQVTDAEHLAGLMGKPL